MRCPAIPRGTVLLSAAVLAMGCGSDDNASSTTAGVTSVTNVPATAGPVTTGEPVTTAAPVTTASATGGPTLEQVRETLYGTATCLDDPGCPIIESVAVAGDFLQIQTGLFRDSDAVIPGLSACNAVAANLWEGFVQVLGTDGGPIASGKRGQIPICEVRI